MDRIVGIIAARMDSSRLPGKALIPVEGRPLLEYVVRRARRVEGLDELVIATTLRPVDDPLLEFARAADVPAFRGDLEDVAGRFLSCAREKKAGLFVRMNGDSPFLDPLVIGQGIERARAKPADLVTNLVERTYPYGIAVEVVRTSSFERAYAEMKTEEDRTHVTIYFYKNPGRFSVESITRPASDLQGARLVVDTPEDLSRFKAAARSLGDSVLTVDYEAAARLYIEMEKRAP